VCYVEHGIFLFSFSLFLPSSLPLRSTKAFRRPHSYAHTPFQFNRLKRSARAAPAARRFDSRKSRPPFSFVITHFPQLFLGSSILSHVVLLAALLPFSPCSIFFFHMKKSSPDFRIQNGYTRSPFGRTNDLPFLTSVFPLLPIPFPSPYFLRMKKLPW